jgi:hypothetical protein
MEWGNSRSRFRFRRSCRWNGKVGAQGTGQFTVTGNGNSFTNSAVQGSIADQYNNNYTDTSGYAPSDRKLKTNIKKISISKSGLNIYSFEYIDEEKFGKGVFQGVMSDEVPKNTVLKDASGYDAVDYSLIDVEFKKL